MRRDRDDQFDSSTEEQQQEQQAPPPRSTTDRAAVTTTTTISGGAENFVRPVYEPACSFPYTLDKFQQDSIDFLEAGDSVLVSAHTSAGKTTVAIYAIARALKQRKRVIYTSPIKALSNQKFKELSERFDSVGLMTGDTTIKADSDCLVMTTEILRSMLYRGTEMLREVGCVIFDEVHYMRDKNRGVVWEETIIMLPEKCQCVFLSATIPNAKQFSGWFEKIHPSQRCHVVHTNYRPVPLQHYLFPLGAQGIFLIIDEQSKFRDENFKQAMAVVRPDNSNTGDNGDGGGEGLEGGAQQQKRGGGGGARNKRATEQAQTRAGVMNIVQLVMERDMYPAIVFGFAKVDCERNAMALAKINFNNKEEEEMVTEVYNNAIESLGEDDRSLPAVEHLLPLLRRGVGIHHSGLLPILKEVVELLFGAGLVKCLFSTETFSMGLNMPARTVIFTGVTKWDGSDQRLLTGGEYIQMSGRAGRRGLDRVGIVIAMVNDSVQPDKLKEMMSGGADVLNSSFHLTYNMVLNLLRVEDANPEYIMLRSFSQFQREGQKPALEQKIKFLEAHRDEKLNISEEDREIFEEYENCKAQIASIKKQMKALIHQPRNVNPYIVAGRPFRMVRASDGIDFGWGVASGNYRCIQGVGLAGDEEISRDPSQWTLDVAVLCYKKDLSLTSAQSAVPCPISEYASDVAELQVLTFSHLDIADVSRMRMNLPNGAFSTPEGKQRVVQTVGAMWSQYKGELPVLSAKELNVAKNTNNDNDDDEKTKKQKNMTSEEYAKLEGRLERIEKMFAQNELTEACVARDNVLREAGLLEKDQPKSEARAPVANSSLVRDTLKKNLDEASRNLLSAHEVYLERIAVEKEIAGMKQVIQSMEQAVLQEELKKMIRVMRRMDYLDRDNILMRKGRVACEITTSDENELLLTELLFRGTLNNLETEMVIALLSCLVTVTKMPDGFRLAEEFQWPLNELKEVVKRIASVSLESGLSLDGALLDVAAADGNNAAAGAGGGGKKKSYVDEKVNPTLMEVTYRWAKGAKFVEVMGITQAYEGDIVRMMRRLEELLRQMATAAKSPAIGAPELHDKFMAGIQMIKRDIVFASSLYL